MRFLTKRGGESGATPARTEVTVTGLARCLPLFGT